MKESYLAYIRKYTKEPYSNLYGSASSGSSPLSCNHNCRKPPAVPLHMYHNSSAHKIRCTQESSKDYLTAISKSSSCNNSTRHVRKAAGLRGLSVNVRCRYLGSDVFEKRSKSTVKDYFELGDSKFHKRVKSDYSFNGKRLYTKPMQLTEMNKFTSPEAVIDAYSGGLRTNIPSNPDIIFLADTSGKSHAKGKSQPVIVQNADGLASFGKRVSLERINPAKLVAKRSPDLSLRLAAKSKERAAQSLGKRQIGSKLRYTSKRPAPRETSTRLKRLLSGSTAEEEGQGREQFIKMLLNRSKEKVVKEEIPLLVREDISLEASGTKSAEKSAVDPRRKEEMMEASKKIKDHWKRYKLAPETTADLYKVGKVLGKGAFGKVNLAIHKLSGKLVAIKSIEKQIMKDEASKEKVMKEVAIWEKLTHPSIIR